MYEEWPNGRHLTHLAGGKILLFTGYRKISSIPKEKAIRRKILGGRAFVHFVWAYSFTRGFFTPLFMPES
jgi:hypothetical protein